MKVEITFTKKYRKIKKGDIVGGHLSINCNDKRELDYFSLTNCMIYRNEDILFIPNLILPDTDKIYKILEELSKKYNSSEEISGTIKFEI